ncbi:MBL fold metallo-hydrolase [Lacisediminihabitans changchengi]|uniref:MBL fold metallo-hydrolase n=1 Tax=Lacisediminihabitans changchengi TaxID=2787634 RepID=A0A934SK12_9MICO|nr:MBL fold metallo-hydrolase [Lacisediminihabitans changchengi]MBK4346750.1 MBL fold metallo-hydrolase [Lacisediminihabitans changchengi]MBK4348127.1 MBL fold metallo-hydrolase [Lacisediminihabitans changchengi]
MSSSAWTEIADGVSQRRYDPEDVSIVAIVGTSGVSVIDTRNNPAEGEEMIADVEHEFGLPIVAVINTHAHYDHTFGNQVFAARGIPIYGHYRIAAHHADYEAPRVAAAQADPAREPGQSWADVVLTAPTVLISEPSTVDLGGRAVELIPIDPGHTDTDIAVFVPDVRVWALGDVIEQSGPPMFGSGSFPLLWPDAVARLLDSISSSDPIIPGHGTVVDRDFVERQIDQLAAVAHAIRSRHAAGLSVAAAVAEGGLELWPAWMLESAFARGYAQLDAQTS